MRIGLDLDGVICDSIPIWRHVLIRELGLVHGPGDLPDTHGTPACAAVMNRHEVECLITPPPVPGAAAGLRALQAAGHELVVVTARTPRMAELTRAWLAYHGLPVPDRMHFLAGGSKGAVARAEGLDLFVEDAPHNAQSITGAGVPVLLFAWPYNEGFHHPLARRVAGWDAVPAAVGGWGVQAPTGTV